MAYVQLILKPYDHVIIPGFITYFHNYLTMEKVLPDANNKF